MCWIFAYTGEKSASQILLQWLSNLEYRGYDSAGLFMVNQDHEIYLKKSLGRVSNLASLVDLDWQKLGGFHSGIAHTRWATHGGVTLENTHPHSSQNQRFHLVHNGIIENYIELKKELQKDGYHFYGDTDSEVVAKLIEKHFQTNLVETLKIIEPLLTWAYALAVMDRENPSQIVALKLGSPLVIWLKDQDLFLSSDANALANITDNYIPIDDHEMVIIDPSGYRIISAGAHIEKEQYESFKHEMVDDMGAFEHFMLKEIFESPSVVENILWGRVFFDSKEIKSNALSRLDIESIQKIEIIASGTSYNAGLTGCYFFEELASIPCQIHISTEFKYKKQFINPNTLYIFISQSGETADSLECLKMVKNKGGKTFGIVNVVWSSIARLCDNGLYTHCGVEVGVAATKTFIGQLLTILIIALYIGNKKDLDYGKYREIIEWLAHLKDDLNLVLAWSHKIEALAKKYSIYENAFFLGRNMFYPIAMEWSLKCKEITYYHTEAYSAGELKHGPLSLISENFPSLLINPLSPLYEKNISTLKEIQARNGKVIWVISVGDEHKNEYTDLIEIPKSSPFIALFTVSVSLQLYAYYVANTLGREIDKPRNLAKSVTVE